MENRENTGKNKNPLFFYCKKRHGTIAEMNKLFPQDENRDNVIRGRDSSVPKAEKRKAQPPEGKGIPPKDDLPVQADDSGMTREIRRTVTIRGALSVLLSNTFQKIFETPQERTFQKKLDSVVFFIRNKTNFRISFLPRKKRKGEVTNAGNEEKYENGRWCCFQQR